MKSYADIIMAAITLNKFLLLTVVWVPLPLECFFVSKHFLELRFRPIFLFSQMFDLLIVLDIVFSFWNSWCRFLDGILFSHTNGVNKLSLWFYRSWICIQPLDNIDYLDLIQLYFHINSFLIFVNFFIIEYFGFLVYQLVKILLLLSQYQIFIIALEHGVDETVLYHLGDQRFVEDDVLQVFVILRPGLT